MKNVVKKGIVLLFTASLILVLGACGGKSAGSGGAAQAEAGSAGTGSVIVGSKDFTENEIVAEIYALALEDAGFTVERKMNIAGSVVHTSITSAEIDIYPEYTGTGLITILGMEALTDQDAVYNSVKEAYNERFNITWLDYAEANDGQGLFISKKASDEYGITNISQLQANADKLRFCSQGEFDDMGKLKETLSAMLDRREISPNTTVAQLVGGKYNKGRFGTMTGVMGNRQAQMNGRM